jgi:ABC-type sugar transport system ATPase subunit
MMVGREIGTYFPRSNATKGAVTLEVRGLGKRGKFHDVTFHASSGEIVGIAGLMGAGRTEVAEAIMGLDPPDEGEIFLKGQKVHLGTPHAAIEAGLAFVPEDRKLKGLNLKASVGHNITLTSLDRFCAGTVIRGKQERAAIDQQIRALSIKTPDRNRVVNTLSGGNQQKVVLAKTLIGTPEVFIFDEPTRGIDVGAKSEIYRLMAGLAKAGKTIVMISSEMPELVGMSDRIVVFSRGTVVGEIARKDFNQETILARAMGGQNGQHRDNGDRANAPA